MEQSSRGVLLTQKLVDFFSSIKASCLVKVTGCVMLTLSESKRRYSDQVLARL